MNPHQLAKEECANYDGGGCLNIIILDDLTNHSGPRIERCKLLDGQKCRYFEDCVLPLVTLASDPDRVKAFTAASTKYKLEHKMDGVGRVCPDCARPLGYRKQLCPVCAKMRQKIRNRRRRRKRG